MDVWILEDRFGIRCILDSEEKAFTYAKDYIENEYKKGSMGVYEYTTTLQDLNDRKYTPFMLRNIFITKQTVI